MNRPPLTFSEIEKLFGLVRRLKEQGVSIIYISHRLDEVFELCDKITVMKDGAVVQTVDAGRIDKKALISSMVGRELSTLFPKREAQIGEVVLKASHLTCGTMVKDVSFEVRK